MRFLCSDVGHLWEEHLIYFLRTRWYRVSIRVHLSLVLSSPHCTEPPASGFASSLQNVMFLKWCPLLQTFSKSPKYNSHSQPIHVYSILCQAQQDDQHLMSLTQTQQTFRPIETNFDRTQVEEVNACTFSLEYLVTGVSWRTCDSKARSTQHRSARRKQQVAYYLSQNTSCERAH